MSTLKHTETRLEQCQRKHLYTGRELQPNSTRPGAMDAYSLPSVVAGVRIARVMPLCAPTTTKTTISTKY
jgi:hypothetical protein